MSRPPSPLCFFRRLQIVGKRLVLAATRPLTALGSRAFGRGSLGRRFRSSSLSAQVFCLAAVCLVLTSGAALLSAGVVAMRMRASGLVLDELLRLHLTLVLCLITPVSIGLVMIAVRHLLLRPLHEMRKGLANVIEGKLETIECGTMPNREWRDLQHTFDRMVAQLRAAHGAQLQAERILAERTQTVDRLLEFSQTIQGAGLADQVYTTLSHFLEGELGLVGVAVLAHQTGQLPPIQLKAGRPSGIFAQQNSACEMNESLCPCLRQNLAKEFKPGHSTVRCSIDACLSLAASPAAVVVAAPVSTTAPVSAAPPASAAAFVAAPAAPLATFSLSQPQDHPAYCIPFNVGRDTRIVVHMLLPLGQHWTADRKQLAQTYVNSAVSSLISLHLLAEAEKQSMTDVLTGLYNRRSMEQLLQREVALSERHGHPLTVVMVDLDLFKQINDVHGHAAGDHMLKSFADCVRITLRKTDLAFRFGGDEFVIALPQTPLGQAQQVVEKLRQAYAAVDFSHAITRLDRQPTLSIGVAEREPSHKILTLDNLLAAADVALYDAKTHNRNCVKVYTPIKAA